MSTINEDHMIYGSWNIRCHRQIFVILDHFLLFQPPMDPENQNFDKMKQTPGDIIILHMSTINYSRMMNGS